MKDQICDPRGSARVLSRWLILGAMFSAVVSASADSVVLPGVAENDPGSWGFGWEKGYSQRVQQVVNSEELSSVMPNGALINGVSFRMDEAGLPYTITFDSVEVKLSTTSARADGLSEVFAQNVGADEAVVYSTGPVRWVFSFVQSGPKSFDAVIPFMTPFLYDPQRGALLIDMTFINPDSTDPGQLLVVDAHLQRADGFSGVFASLVANPDLNVGFAQSFGYVMRLDFTAIPEPSTSALVVSGVCLLLLPHCAYTRARGALAI